MHSVSLAHVEQLFVQVEQSRFKESDSFLYSPSSQALTH